MKISIFGNPDLETDNLPVKLLPKLRERFPKLEFNVEDPNELDIPEITEWTIIDTVVGIGQVKLLITDDLKKIPKNRVSMHGFDLGTHLFWLEKIKPGMEIKIIGIPPTISENEAVEGISKILASLLPKSAPHS
jgi:hypothetical protein